MLLFKSPDLDAPNGYAHQTAQCRVDLKAFSFTSSEKDSNTVNEPRSSNIRWRVALPIFELAKRETKSS
jgi:hypothetical protein